MTPVLPYVALPPYIYSALDKSRYTGWLCSRSGVHMYPPALYPPPPLLRLDAGIPTAPPCCALAALPPFNGPYCGGIHQGSSLSWGSPPRSRNQTKGLPEILPCTNFWRSRGLPPPAPKSCINVPIYSELSGDYQPLPASHHQIQLVPVQGI